MRASMIVVADPGADLRARVIEAEEQRFVQKLIGKRDRTTAYRDVFGVG